MRFSWATVIISKAHVLPVARIQVSNDNMPCRKHYKCTEQQRVDSCEESNSIMDGTLKVEIIPALNEIDHLPLEVNSLLIQISG
jgi:hypothetical protein